MFVSAHYCPPSIFDVAHAAVKFVPGFRPQPLDHPSIVIAVRQITPHGDAANLSYLGVQLGWSFAHGMELRAIDEINWSSSSAQVSWIKES
jgi:hypothetical protein